MYGCAYKNIKRNKNNRAPSPLKSKRTNNSNEKKKPVNINKYNETKAKHIVRIVHDDKAEQKRVI